MITIEINSIDKSSIIEQETVELNMTLTKEPAVLSFVVKGNKTQPALGDSVVLKEDGDAFFKGVITESQHKLLGNYVDEYKYVCKDDTYSLDRRLVVKAYNNTDAVAVVQDIIDTFTTGFTLDAPNTSPSVASIRFNYVQPSQAISKIANSIGWDWHVGPNNTVCFYPPETTPAPFTITDDNGNLAFKTLEFNRNIVELRNVVYVRGGEYTTAITEGNAVDKYEADGTQDAFPLAYRYENVEVTIDGSAQTVGIDYIDDFSGVDCLYNFEEKMVKFGTTPIAGEVIKVFGDAKVPLSVRAEDGDSIASYGRQEAIEVNKSINSIEEAETLAYGLLERWREGASEGSFQTRTKGLRVGQSLTINSTKFGINDNYKVNRVRGTMNGKDEFIYTIEFIKSGQVTFNDIMLGILGREKENIQISADEVLQIFRNFDDSFSLSDELVSITASEGPYHWSPVTTGTAFDWNFGTWS